MNTLKLFMMLAGITFAIGCDPQPAPMLCNSGDGPLVRELAVNFNASQIKTMDMGGATIPLTISAIIPCLRGGTHAEVTSSKGAIGGATVGSSAKVFLAPTGTVLEAGTVEGVINLELQSGEVARVDARIGDYSAIREIGVP